MENVIKLINKYVSLLAFLKKAMCGINNLFTLLCLTSIRILKIPIL